MIDAGVEIEKLRRKVLERINRKRYAYQSLFLVDGKPGPVASVVLKDLKKFCKFTAGGLVISPVSRMSDPYATAYQCGLRDAYTRILLMCGLDGGDIGDDSDERSESARQ